MMEFFIKNGKKITLVLLLGVTGIIWYAVFYFEAHQKLLVTAFDIGQGDSIFIEVPGGAQVLIDGGPDGKVLSKLGYVMPFWDHSIDMLILTHPHADHLDGLYEVLKRYDIGMVVESGVSYNTAEYEEWHMLLQKKHIPAVIARAGDRIYLGKGILLDILLPTENFAGQSLGNVHDSMVVTRLTYGSTAMLFMGDAEKKLEYQLVSLSRNNPFFALHADVLKAGHHGSKTSSTEEFLTTVLPRSAIISVGKKNRYGHPHQEVIERFKNRGINLFRTDERGDVRVVSDGRTIAISGSRP